MLSHNIIYFSRSSRCRPSAVHPSPKERGMQRGEEKEGEEGKGERGRTPGDGTSLTPLRWGNALDAWVDLLECVVYVQRNRNGTSVGRHHERSPFLHPVCGRNPQGACPGPLGNPPNGCILQVPKSPVGRLHLGCRPFL